MKLKTGILPLVRAGVRRMSVSMANGSLPENPGVAEIMQPSSKEGFAICEDLKNAEWFGRNPAKGATHLPT